jgi:hypothetical protein
VHLEELAAAGGNSIRAGTGSLDRAQALGLTVLADLPFAKQRAGFSYDDQAAVATQREQIRQIVLRFKDHPALLAWAVGNELEINTPAPARRAVEGNESGCEDDPPDRSQPSDKAIVAWNGGVGPIPVFMAGGAEALMLNRSARQGQGRTVDRTPFDRFCAEPSGGCAYEYETARRRGCQPAADLVPANGRAVAAAVIPALSGDRGRRTTVMMDACYA